MISGYNWNNMLYGFVWKWCWNWFAVVCLITGNMILIINHPNMFHWRCPMFRQTHMKVPKWPQWCLVEWLIQINGCKAHQSTNDRFVCVSNLGTVPFFGLIRVFPYELDIKLASQESEVAWYSSANGFWILQRIFWVTNDNWKIMENREILGLGFLAFRQSSLNFLLALRIWDPLGSCCHYPMRNETLVTHANTNATTQDYHHGIWVVALPVNHLRKCQATRGSEGARAALSSWG